MFHEYEKFLADFDKKLANYFEQEKEKIFCKKGCSLCCENADYPLSYLEMRYLIQGFLNLEKQKHDLVRENIRNLQACGKQESYVCPFLLGRECSVYSYRPLVCRVHGLGYMLETGKVKLPECANFGLNYSKNFDGKMIDFEPIKEDLNLDKIYAQNNLFAWGEVRSMMDWFE